MGWLLRGAMLYLVAALFFAWGAATVKFQVFPWQPMHTAAAFVRGDPSEHTSLWDKVRNDMGWSPTRAMRVFPLAQVQGGVDLPLPNANERRDAAKLVVAPDFAGNYRLIVGALDFRRALWGAILIDPMAKKIIHSWPLSGEVKELNDLPDQLKNLYGVAFFRDGSAIYNMQEQNNGLIKVDACGIVEWTLPGVFHHVVSPTADMKNIWTFGGQQGDMHPKLMLVDVATGKIVRTIDMADVAAANSETFFFDLQRNADVPHSTHPNDIEPLPSDLADAFPQFEAGDLAISYHTTNLIFVLDPDTLKIRWWYVGAGDGQHDPDWLADGTIALFNNNWRAARRGVTPYSTIVAIDPGARRHFTLVDGRRYDFYSETNGRQTFTDQGTVIIASSRQGRVFEVDLRTGRVVFEFVNYFDQEQNKTLHISEAFAIDKDFFDMKKLNACRIGIAKTEEKQL